VAGEPASVDSGQGGRAAGKVIGVLAFGRQRRKGNGRRSDDDERRLADERRVRRGAGRTAELQAQIALRVVVLNRAVLKAVRHVRSGREEQRDECEQGDQPWMAGTHELVVERFIEVQAAYPLAAIRATHP